ncbi:hypothetical protein DC3_12620 [Deinococcus cellulosilyticus NBRC 106333 = KACC 11606]|uniref:Uncharacterized protein n=1 Tax=Deinococcus cellulosilyticus (strain DSM 18568 / NBRC 106333 / KACC 11606 / 5516J-15) TaxID=1223518 RepID=A0A511MZL6_DEIC1|nr:hypothetical protein DC3_12620 [Deinococcus cellulosilyticus NBRC 106333 = KACC 11606]
MLTGDQDDALDGVVVDLAQPHCGRDRIALTERFSHFDEDILVNLAVPQGCSFTLTELGATGFALEKTPVVLAVGLANDEVVSSRLKVVLAVGGEAS